MTPSDIHQEIMRRLHVVEQQENVRIVLAIESGSRAWGFASPNSDFDVRFIYVRPKDWYVCVDLEERRDVIEYPIVDDIDLNGWDIRKALRLFGKSNPAFVEWIQSPIIYIQQGQFLDLARQALPDIYSIDKGIYHYRSMSSTNYRGYLQDQQVRLKKYFYVLRPLLAVKWLERYQTAAPIEFERLLHLIDDRPDLIQAIHDLLELKRVSVEKALGKPIPLLNEFIQQELTRLDDFKRLSPPSIQKVEVLNSIFNQVLAEA